MTDRGGQILRTDTSDEENMKFSWVNILATLLIVGGLFTMVVNWRSRPAQHMPTEQEAKAAIQKKMETALGRPLSEAETEMFTVSKTPDKTEFTLQVQPLLQGRLAEAARQAKAATQASAWPAPSGSTGSPANGANINTVPAGASTAPSITP
jgi:hypothetical protein